MKQPLKSLLLTLLISSLSVSVHAADPAASQPATAPTPPPAAAPAAAQKPAEVVPAQATTRLGHVDMDRIGAESETGKAGMAQINELKKKLQSQVEAKRKQLDKQKAAIETSLKTLSAQQREAKIKEFQKKVDEFQKFGANAEKQLQAKQEEFSSSLVKLIEQASTELGKAKGLALVVIKRELLYLGSGVDAQDVTDDVIKKIDKK